MTCVICSLKERLSSKKDPEAPCLGGRYYVDIIWQWQLCAAELIELLLLSNDEKFSSVWVPCQEISPHPVTDTCDCGTEGGVI